ncbi:MAG TPA: kinesin, partial [Cyanobacteria bacterium UBA11166]|nr:kinesin [Cyanobacteria bacterium UBA11166]
MKSKLLPSLLTSLIILQLPLAPTYSQNNPNPAQLAQGKTFTPATINGKLDSNSQTLENDKTYYNVHRFSGKAGAQITIELTTSEFLPRLYLFDYEKQIAASYRSGNNARITVTLPTGGTYYIVANATEAGTTGNYTLTWRETTGDDLELAEAEKLNQQVLELDKQGKYDTAIPLAQQALEIRKRILGEKHPDVATSLN